MSRFKFNRSNTPPQIRLGMIVCILIALVFVIIGSSVRKSNKRQVDSGSGYISSTSQKAIPINVEGTFLIYGNRYNDFATYKVRRSAGPSGFYDLDYEIACTIKDTGNGGCTYSVEKGDVIVVEGISSSSFTTFRWTIENSGPPVFWIVFSVFLFVFFVVFIIIGCVVWRKYRHKVKHSAQMNTITTIQQPTVIAATTQPVVYTTATTTTGQPVMYYPPPQQQQQGQPQPYPYPQQSYPQQQQGYIQPYPQQQQQGQPYPYPYPQQQGQPQPYPQQHQQEQPIMMYPPQQQQHQQGQPQPYPQQPPQYDNNNTNPQHVVFQTTTSPYPPINPDSNNNNNQPSNSAVIPPSETHS